MAAVAAVITVAVLLVIGAPWWSALMVGALVLAFYEVN